MNPRNELRSRGGGWWSSFKQWCLRLKLGRLLVVAQRVAYRSPPRGLDAVSTEAYRRAQEVMRLPFALRRMADCTGRLREMFRAGGPLASLRWPWEELVPVVERHIFRVMDATRDIDERYALLFERCAPELLGPERLARMEEVMRRELMSPERTVEERRALAVAVLQLAGAPRTPPYPRQGLSLVVALMMEQVDEWMARRQRASAMVERVLGPEPGTWQPGARASSRAPEEVERERRVMQAVADADPELLEVLGKYEESLLSSIFEGRTPVVLHGEEWLWMTVVLREPLFLERVEQGAPENAEALLARLDEEVWRAVLSRVEAASRDRSSPPEEEQWFLWAYKVMTSRPMAFFGVFAKAREARLRERFVGEADLVEQLRRREQWSAEDLEPYRMRLRVFGMDEAEQRVARLQALLRGEPPTRGPLH